MEDILKKAIGKIISESKFIILSFNDYHELMFKSKLISIDELTGIVKFNDVPIYYDITIMDRNFFIKP